MVVTTDVTTVWTIERLHIEGAYVWKLVKKPPLCRKLGSVHLMIFTKHVYPNDNRMGWRCGRY